MLPEILIHPTFCPGSAMGVHSYISTLLLAYAIIGALLNVPAWKGDNLRKVKVSYGSVNSADPEVMCAYVHVEFNLYSNLPECLKKVLGDQMTVQIAHQMAHDYLPNATAAKLEGTAQTICAEIVNRVIQLLDNCRAKIKASHQYEESGLTALENQFGL